MPKKRTHSRSQTPRDEQEALTPTQEFLQMRYKAQYERRHPSIFSAGEAAMINSYEPLEYPYCLCDKFIRKGFDPNGIRRCKCLSRGRTFKPTTGTIFGSRKISLGERIDYCLNIFRCVSLNADSRNNRNALSTSKYWLEKLFLTLNGAQNDAVLSGAVRLDETYYSVIMRDRKRDEKRRLLSGLSGNQICIGVAADKEKSVCAFEGFGRPAQESGYQTFKNHIQSGSALIHDKEITHQKLVRELNLTGKVCASKDMKGLADSENPLNPANRVRNLLKMFLNARGGFNRDDLQGYLDLYAFVVNPPTEPLEKAEKIIKLAFDCPKSLRYRDQFRKIQTE